VRKIKLHEGAAADQDAADPAEDWPRPMPELACPSAREAALARLYKGRQYDSFQIRPSRNLLNFCVRGRPVNVAA